jgi:hypothetical protein
MPQGPAARITDNVVHPLPPVLTPGPGSPNVLIGFLPAWRGIPAAAAAALQAAKQASDIAIQAAEAATLAAAGTPGAPAAYAAEQAAKTAALSALSSVISGMAGMSDIHEQPHRVQEVVDDHRLEHVQLEVALARRRRPTRASLPITCTRPSSSPRTASGSPCRA